MPASDTFENDFLALFFTNVTWLDVGVAAGIVGAATPGNLTVALSTATLTDTSTQATSEAAYGAYARVNVARSAAAWTVATGTVDNDAVITFATATSGSETELSFSLGTTLVADEMYIRAGFLARSFDRLMEAIAQDLGAFCIAPYT